MAKSRSHQDFLSAWLASLNEQTFDAQLVAAVRSSVVEGRIDEALLRKEVDTVMKQRLRAPTK